MKKAGVLVLIILLLSFSIVYASAPNSQEENADYWIVFYNGIAYIQSTIDGALDYPLIPYGHSTWAGVERESGR
ncbi:MAG: hypothetical protein ABH849_02400, partial [Nanoarchaeota archaeon]